MSNVKPGDLARVIRDTRPGNSNVGKICQIIAVNTEEPAEGAEALFGPFADVEALQPFWAFDFAWQADALCKCGEILTIPMAHLQRIDPPADTETLYEPRALPIDPQYQPKETSDASSA